MKVCLVYHSGTGGTRLVAELLGEMLEAQHRVSITGVSDPRARARIGGSDLLVLCYPTYFLKPSRSMREFIQRLDRSHLLRSVYVVTTYELYSENSLRSCALMLREKGGRLVGSRAIRAPGSDLTCLFPTWAVPWLYRFERGAARKLRLIATEIDAALRDGDARERVPWPKWYTPFSQPLQLIFDRFDRWRSRIRILPQRCTRCGACVADCSRGAWVAVPDLPLHRPELCELCTRCIHRCPRKAIVLIEGLKDNARLNRRFFSGMRDAIRKEMVRN